MTMSSSSVFQVDYSTIRNKSLQANDLKKQEESQKIVKFEANHVYLIYINQEQKISKYNCQEFCC